MGWEDRPKNHQYSNQPFSAKNQINQMNAINDINAPNEPKMRKSSLSLFPARYK